jgi:hypothetical protein
VYYKVLKDGRVIDALDRLQFVKYQPKHDIMVNCTEDDAQGIISSNGKYIWHVEGYYLIPSPEYDTVTLEPIDQIKALGGTTPEAIIDAYTLTLIQGGLL